MWLRTKRTRAPCREGARAGNQVLWADKLGDMITADHKVLNEGGDSRNNHRYSVMVRDLATAMGSIWFVQNENFSGDGKESTKIPRAVGKAQSHLH